MTSRRAALVLIMVLLVALGAVSLWRRAPASPPPNIILITVDTLRPDRIRALGYARDTMPNVERFLGEESLFYDATSPAPCTIPAVRQILTGSLAMGSSPIAEVLRASGYRTAAIVSQHVFHWFRGDGYDRGFDFWDIQREDDVDQHKMTARTAASISGAAVRWLEGTERRQPFFLWLHYFDPHDPYEPPPGFRGYAPPSKRFPSGDRRAYMIAEVGGTQNPWQHAGHIFSEADQDHFIGLYDGEIAFTDQQLGLFLEALAARSLMANTAFIVTSDHGERLGEGGSWDHCLSLHEVETRVPLWMHLPDTHAPLAEADRRVPVSTLDLYPTILELAGLPADDATLSGHSLLAPEADRAIVSAFRGHATIRKGGYKLYCRLPTCVPQQLVTVDGMQEEIVPLDTPQTGALRSALSSVGGFLDTETITKMRQDMERLRSLGYTN